MNPQRISLTLAASLAIFASCRHRPSNEPEKAERGTEGAVISPEKSEEIEGLSKTSELAPFRLVVADGTGAPASYDKLFVGRSQSTDPNRMESNPSLEKPIPMASATKWLVGVVLMRLIDKGLITLETKAKDVLLPGESVTNGADKITLAQLLSLTSGVSLTTRCAPDLSFQDCAREVLRSPLDSEPGTLFQYGSAHLNVAGAMAEAVSSKSWNQLFQEEIYGPFGLKKPAGFYGDPFSRTQQERPGLGGGLVMAPEDYARILKGLLSNKDPQGKQYLKPSTLQFLEKDRLATVGMKRTPARFPSDAFETMHYALGHWRVCSSLEEAKVVGTGKDCKASVFASPGAFGFFPWIDRSKNQYGMIVMFDVRDAQPEILVKKQQELFQVFRLAAKP